MEKIDKQAVLDLLDKYNLDSEYGQFCLKREINALPTTTDEWVSVETALPKDEQVVLVWQLVLDNDTERGTRRLAYIFEGRWYTGIKQILRVSAWMPLPQPPTK
jgi:hypothetical protein